MGIVNIFCMRAYVLVLLIIPRTMRQYRNFLEVLHKISSSHNVNRIITRECFLENRILS